MGRGVLYVSAFLFSLPVCVIAACGAIPAATSTSIPLVPPTSASVSTAVASPTDTAKPAKPTDTPNPIRPTDTAKPVGGIQPPLSADEMKAQGIMTEFFQAVTGGQQAYARSMMESNYSATVANLYDALGLPKNPNGFEYQLLPDHREGDSIVFAVNINFPEPRLRGSVTLTPSIQGWRVTRIVAAH